MPQSEGGREKERERETEREVEDSIGPSRGKREKVETFVSWDFL